MKFNNNFVKATAAAALTVTGIGAIHAANTGTTTSHVQAATMRVKINYVPGYGINIWSNFNHGRFIGQRAQHGSTWNVLDTQTDAKGNTWYEIGQNQWIMAKYTVSAAKPVKSNPAPAATNSVKKAVKHSRQASGNASSIITLAQAQLGKKYVWGGTTTNGFDCSGLVQYVYKNAAGIDVTRTTYSQVKQGRQVSLKSLQPGDLLFWGSAAAPYHVGIYVGNGKYIHAATPSQGVIEQNISSYYYPSTARRILG